ncbi:hypothetical protein [Methylobacterium marchantiae]|uniref:Uncharacterized protein n=1 Tax=Methylobacterium marchantiae TaxID=600331 RepID=A0ABW3X3J5_9HYPH|nr:hypothetical protein AIGOOFII_3456 [Methylobacterium marchantiae]
MKTYADIKAETETRRLESDLQNLATAHVQLQETIEAVDEEQVQRRQLQQEIDAIGSGARPTLSTVKALYARAMKLRS